MTDTPAEVPTTASTPGLPSDRSLWRAGETNWAGIAKFSGTPAALARLWLWVIGGVVALFGAVSTIGGRLAKVAAYNNFSGLAANDHVVPGADTADAWLYTGIVALLLGISILLVQLFLFAYSDRRGSSVE